MTMPPQRERRRHPRYPAHLQVDYRQGDGHFLFAYVENISEMGIFLQTEEPLPVGTELVVRFQQGERPLQLRGRVVWINPARRDGTDLNPGMGIQFVELQPEERERLVQIVKTVAYLAHDATESA